MVTSSSSARDWESVSVGKTTLDSLTVTAGFFSTLNSGTIVGMDVERFAGAIEEAGAGGEATTVFNDVAMSKISFLVASPKCKEVGRKSSGDCKIATISSTACN